MCYPQPQKSRRSEPTMDRVPAPGEPAQLFIDGAFRTAERAEQVIEAGTGEPLGSGCAATEAEVDRAVSAACAALPGWREVPVAERAAAIANDSEFGLGGSVWSTDVERATDIARAVHTGTIGINDYQLDMGAPFGGVKSSGMGRELGPEGLAAYQILKSIYRVG
ncbi:aldehyde dehydrogenase family protein [Mycolicibacterium lutetiense]